MIKEISDIKEVTLELDADSIAHAAGWIVDSQDGDMKFAYTVIDSMMASIYNSGDYTQCNVYLGGDTNYRNDVATVCGYKANRKDKKEPKYYQAIRERMFSKHNAILIEGQEAEDAVGIASMRHKSFDDFVIGNIDKDVDMLPGMHYNYRKKVMYSVSKIEGMRNFYKQLVTGDKQTDNIPGLYHLLLHLGKDDLAAKLKSSKYVTKLSKELADKNTEMEMWETVNRLYTEWEMEEDYLIKEVGQLLWLRRYPDEIWVPPTERDFDYITIDKREEEI